MEHRGLVLRPRCIGPRRARTQIPFIHHTLPGNIHIPQCIWMRSIWIIWNQSRCLYTPPININASRNWKLWRVMISVLIHSNWNDPDITVLDSWRYHWQMKICECLSLFIDCSCLITEGLWGCWTKDRRHKENWRTLHNQKLHNFYPVSNTRMTKSRRARCVGHVACMGGKSCCTTY
jgi:hypothetical protein